MKYKILWVVFTLAWVLAGCTPSNGPASTSYSFPSATSPQADFSATPSPSPSPTITSTPEPSFTFTPEPSPTPQPAVLIGAGDIAICGAENQGDEQTAALIARQIEQHPQAVVMTIGDNAYGEGRAVEFRNCFDPSWGKFKDRIRPALGNHDYGTDQAAPYFDYFGEAAGPRGLGYYSYDLNEWHIVVLNSICNEIACGPNSQQAQWLREDLEASHKECTLLYWHNPRYSSGPTGGYGSVNTFWKIAHEFNAEVVVNADDHNYERFAPMDVEGSVDPNGVRQFVVGTGGGILRYWGEVKPASEARYIGFGVIQFNLYPGHYDWEFFSTDNSFSDTGSGTCR